MKNVNQNKIEVAKYKAFGNAKWFPQRVNFLYFPIKTKINIIY